MLAISFKKSLPVPQNVHCKIIVSCCSKGDKNADSRYEANFL